MSDSFPEEVFDNIEIYINNYLKKTKTKTITILRTNTYEVLKRADIWYDFRYRIRVLIFIVLHNIVANNF